MSTVVRGARAARRRVHRGAAGVGEQVEEPALRGVGAQSLRA